MAFAARMFEAAVITTIVLAGCAADDPGNWRLGIARFEVSDSAERTTVVGLDPDGTEVARLDLVHGRFVPGGALADDVGGAELVGRSLRVAVRGQRLRWETPGFQPILHMPAHPASQWALAAFLSDPHVAPVLARWQIGFEPVARTAAPGYRFAASGTHPRACPTGARCPTMFAASPAPNSCGGTNDPADSDDPDGPRGAYIIHQRGVDWNGHTGEHELGGEYALQGLGRTTLNQSVIVECCKPNPARRTPQAFFEFKTCPDPCSADPAALCPSTCGSTRFGGCIACADYAILSDRCVLDVVDAGWIDPHAPHDLVDPSGDDKRVVDIYYRAGWTCGDGVCDTDESCTSCAADCSCAP